MMLPFAKSLYFLFHSYAAPCTVVHDTIIVDIARLSHLVFAFSVHLIASEVLYIELHDYADF